MKHIKNAIITLFLLVLYTIIMIIFMLVLLIGYVPCLALDIIAAYKNYRHMHNLYREIDCILSKKESKA
jgi:TM2 domain-containing membrane protein YozV